MGRLPAFLWCVSRLSLVRFKGAQGKTTRDFLKNHAWKFLKPRVTFLKTTRGFIQESPGTHLKRPLIDPKKPPPATIFPASNCRGSSHYVILSQVQVTGVPGPAGVNGDKMPPFTPGSPAKRIIPSEMPTDILRGARFATKTTSLPISAAGSG